MRISIIVPAYNNGRHLAECLSALQAASRPDSEILVIDDASTDGTPIVAARMGVRVLLMARNSGPAAVRNYGAHYAAGDILFFVDADVVIAPGAVDRVVKVIEENPDLAAVFGSYDASPNAKGLVSRYRNLLHHFVHQNGNPEASTFWAGCGAIRRQAFETVGGFDEKRFPRSSIEDIELGYRLREAGYRILLDKTLQGTPLKRWTFRSVLWTDIFCRAIPWARLAVERRKLPDDLNLKRTQRLSGTFAMVGCPLLPFGLISIELFVLAVSALLSVAFLNRDLYTFFFRQHGLRFAAACIVLHLLYYLYSGFSFLFVWLQFQIKSIGGGTSGPIREN